MDTESFANLLAPVTASVEGRNLDKQLEHDLNQRFPASGETVKAIFAACRAAIEAGWMCNRESDGIRYGRVIKPGPNTHGFSVDVVEMESKVGPHHRHPNGEIDLVLPITSGAKFDERPAGWLVYGPDSAHCPTVTTGKALILYLLPGGSIEFTKS